MTDSRTPSDKWKRHWCVDPTTGTSTCGVFPAVPAKDVLEVDCKRCMRGSEYEAAIRCARRRQALREYAPPKREIVVIDFAARQRREGVTNGAT